MNRNMIWVFIFVMLISGAGEGFSQPDDNESKLRGFFSAKPYSLDSLLSGEAERISMEMGDRAIPILKDALHHPDRNLAGLAVSCLLYIDDQQVIDILKAASAGSNSVQLKRDLCLAMSVTNSSADIDFLISSLDTPAVGKERAIAGAAAYSLAVLNAKQAKAALEQRMQKQHARFPSEVADIRFALDHINGRAWTTPQDAATISPEESVILAVLRFGIPYLPPGPTFFDPKGKRIWKQDQGTWTYEKGESDDSKYPALSFAVFVTKDGKHAACSVTVSDGVHAHQGACPTKGRTISQVKVLSWQ